MSARDFRDDDAGYLAWLAAHPDGYVINIARSPSATEARVHHAGCRTISGQIPRGGAWTGPYVKFARSSWPSSSSGRSTRWGSRSGGAGPATRLATPYDPFQPSGPNGRSRARCPRVASRSTDRRRAVP